MPIDPHTVGDTIPTVATGGGAVAILGGILTWLVKRGSTASKALHIARETEAKIKELTPMVIAQKDAIQDLAFKFQKIEDQGRRNEATVAELRGEYRASTSAQNQTMNEMQTCLARILGVLEERDRRWRSGDVGGGSTIGGAIK